MRVTLESVGDSAPANPLADLPAWDLVSYGRDRIQCHDIWRVARLWLVGQMLLRWVLGVLEGSAPTVRTNYSQRSVKRYHGGFLRRL